MKKYEIIFIVRPNLEEEATKTVCETIKNVLEENKAKIIDVKNMGRKELAYEIATFNNGNYFVISFEGDTKAVNEINRVANINEDIIRHIIINREK